MDAQLQEEKKTRKEKMKADEERRRSEISAFLADQKAKAVQVNSFSRRSKRVERFSLSPRSVLSFGHLLKNGGPSLRWMQTSRPTS